ncbi:MAG: cyclase family protein [Planctomycetes bacterium]|nr:cyclase family protein [Planctomycetota bacterium]
MSRYIDVSMPIANGMLVWPTDPGVEVRVFKSPSKGDRSTVSEITMGTHTGTHIDAPKHFLPEAEGVQALDLDALIGRCTVLDVRGVGNVEPEHLKPALDAGAERILLRTGTIEKQLATGFSKDYPGITAAGAKALADAGVRLVGIDTMSVEVYHAPGAPTHTTLLEARIVVIENLLLADVPAGDYDLIALPLLIADADGAPARVLLRRLAD